MPSSARHLRFLRLSAGSSVGLQLQAADWPSPSHSATRQAGCRNPSPSTQMIASADAPADVLSSAQLDTSTVAGWSGSRSPGSCSDRWFPVRAGVDPAGGTGTIAQSGGRDAVGWRLPRDIGCAGAIQLSAWLDSEPVGVGLVLGGLLVLAGVYVGALRPARMTPAAVNTKT
jgi:hypothetical protein